METEIKSNGKTLKIVQDSHGESPRSWDNLGQMIFFGKLNHLGDEHSHQVGEYESRQEFMEKGAKNLLKSLGEPAIVLPVHHYEHSGCGISTKFEYPYNCQWDSGTIGFAVVTHSAIRENWGLNRVTKAKKAHALEILEGEVETLSHFISGEVYGFQIEDENGEETDSCYGFFGDNWETNGMCDYLDEDLKTALLAA